jgi:protein translocase SecG subunit
MALVEILQIISAVLLITTILMQHRSSGLSATFGGTGGGSFVQRRGAEKVIYQASIVLAIIFFALAVIRWYV